MLSVSQLQSKIDHLKGQRDALRKQEAYARNMAQEKESDIQTLDHVCTLFKGLIDQEVQTATEMVERLLTEGLQAVFSDQDLSVKAVVGVAREKVVVDLITVQKQADGTVTEGLASDSFGGSVATVESALLRLVVIFRRDLRKLLLLDETFPAFDANYVSNMGRFLTLLCEKLALDILLVSHNPTMVEVANKAYTIVKSKGAARFVEMVR
jgi:hypothetical protein